jgi:O-methyltransferase
VQLDPTASLYLDLLKRTLTRAVLGDRLLVPSPAPRLLERVAGSRGYQLSRWKQIDAKQREVGSGLPPEGETMIGEKRLDNLQHCAVDAIQSGVPGDFIETGVWRGGACILLRGVLAALGSTDRKVWVADSFAGLPPPELDRYPQDAGDTHYTRPELAISVDQVKANFSRYGLLDDQVQFLVGWFSDTLPTAPIDKLAVLRLDGDMYSSTMDAISVLYPKVSAGGYVIVDDYGAIPTCKAAIEDYRRDNGITDPIEQIDWTGVFWRKSAA